ncbi:MAG: SGNH/GDSL hydrolase family protein [Alphaproteobacteria bacterium]|nr:MAG: SGNH/GDSL hydrolase family protein [Alphaproteobacteria bacterium]
MKTLVCIGDSLIEGEGDELSLGGWVGRVGQKLAPNLGHQAKGWRYYNLGIGGDTIRDVHKRLGEVLAREPDVVIVGCGANDVVGGDTQAMFMLDQYEKTWAEVLTKLKALVPHVMVVMGFVARDTSVYAPNWRADYADAFMKHEQNVMALCAKMDITLIQLSTDFGAPELLSHGVHYNARGYDALAQMVFEVLEESNWIKE